MSARTRESWLEAHPYLRPIAELSARVERAASEIDLPPAPLPDFDAFREEHAAGIPLLSSAVSLVEAEPAGQHIAALLRNLVGEPLPGSMAEEVSGLAAKVRSNPELSARIVQWLLGDDSFEPSSPGLLRFLGWTALARHLGPAVEAFARWRDEDRWLRRYCPTCGSLPAMAQIAGVDQVRLRLLSCGCCQTRWRYRRTQCPFCENDSQRLSGIKLEGEPELRIDHCQECRGYLKTYVGQGEEQLLLADWSSLHLDLLAHDRGLKRQAMSLFDLESLVRC